MLFTGEQIVTYARDRAVRGKNVPLDDFMVARQLNDLVRSLVLEYMAEDPERLAEEIVISNADTIASTTEIDLTASDTREWLSIIHIDYSTDGVEYGDEVVLGTIEARHRLTTEYGHLGDPIAYLFDRMRKLKKVDGWDGVYDLRCYGVVAPTEFDSQDSEGFTRVLDYPAPFFRAMQAGFLLRIAPHLNPSELEMSLWANELASAMERVKDDATQFALNRVEDVPHLGQGV